MSSALDAVLATLRDARRSGNGWSAHCPAHDDREASLSIAAGTTRDVVVTCFVGCQPDAIVRSLGLDPGVILGARTDDRRNGPTRSSRGQREIVTVASLARVKGVPEELLRQLGLRDVPGAVEIPYHDTDGTELFVRRRLTLTGKNKTLQPSGVKLRPYGLDRLAGWHGRDALLLVEGESDCWAGWHHGVAVLGLPGANAAGSLDLAHIATFSEVFVVEEPDAGGASFGPNVRGRLDALGWHGSAFAVQLHHGGRRIKDLADLHLAVGGDRSELWSALAEARARAVPRAVGRFVSSVPFKGVVLDETAAPMHPPGGGDGGIETLAFNERSECIRPEPLTLKGGRNESGDGSLFQTAPEIAAATPAATAWVARPYVARGAITELDGKLKSSGKTTWLLALARAVLDGAPFMGWPTERTGVVYLSEQAAPSFRAGLARAGLLEQADLIALLWNRARGLSWPLIVQAAVIEAERRGAGLLIVDTLGQFAGITGDGENDAGAALEAMAPLQAAAAAGLAVVISRHERKSGGEVGESGRGSSAYSGSVDVVLSLRRVEGQAKPSTRVIQALSRFDETPAELVIDLVDGRYRSLGTGQEAKAHEARTLILEQLPPAEDSGLTTKEIVDAIGAATLKRTLVFQVLDDLRESGAVHHSGGGKRGDPYRYWRRPAADSSAPAAGADESADEIRSAAGAGGVADAAAGADHHAPDPSDPDVDRCRTCGVNPVEMLGLDCDECLETTS